jgi:hypothetical protein
MLSATQLFTFAGNVVHLRLKKANSIQTEYAQQITMPLSPVCGVTQ